MRTKYFTADELAREFGVHRTTIWRMAARGDLPAPLRVGRICRWRPQDIEAWRLENTKAEDGTELARREQRLGLERLKTTLAREPDAVRRMEMRREIAQYDADAKA